MVITRLSSKSCHEETHKGALAFHSALPSSRLPPVKSYSYPLRLCKPHHMVTIYCSKQILDSIDFSSIILFCSSNHVMLKKTLTLIVGWPAPKPQWPPAPPLAYLPLPETFPTSVPPNCLSFLPLLLWSLPNFLKHHNHLKPKYLETTAEISDNKLLIFYCKLLQSTSQKVNGGYLAPYLVSNS